MRIAQAKQKSWYDQKSRDRSFEEGEQVLVLLPSTIQKLQAQWQGPFLVKRKVSPVDYEVDMPHKRKRMRIVHVNMLRKYHTTESHSCMVDVHVQVPDSDEDDSLGGSIPSLVENCESRVSEVTFGPDLRKEQQEQLKEITLEFAEVLQDNPGRASVVLIQHHVDTGEARPIRQQPYRLPHARRALVNQEVEKMLKMGVIQPSSSEWCSPVLLVPKKDGSTRFCIDFRRLNSVAKFDAYPMPSIDDLLDSLGGAKFISSLDLTRGYWQIPLSEESQQKPAFSTPQGLFEFVTMPFGLSGAPATFQRMMNQLLAGKGDFAKAYLDDLVIFSKTWEDHLQHIKLVLQKLKEEHLTAKPSKCKLGMRETPYLGYVVGNDTVQPSEGKVRSKVFPGPSEPLSTVYPKHGGGCSTLV